MVNERATPVVILVVLMTTVSLINCHENPEGDARPEDDAGARDGDTTSDGDTTTDAEVDVDAEVHRDAEPDTDRENSTDADIEGSSDAEVDEEESLVLRTDALVLVNGASPSFADFERFVEPYLRSFGVPYMVRDIGAEPLGEDITDFALVIVGHRALDADGRSLDAAEQALVVGAVRDGTGLVSFDNALVNEDGSTRYSFIQEIFGFDFGGATEGSGVSFTSDDGSTSFFDCWDDEHQDPVLATTTDTGDLNPDDGAWTEFHWVPGRPYPTVCAGVDEAERGLPVLRFYADGVPDGRYEVVANLYTSGAGRDLRYFYSFSSDDPRRHSVDTIGGAGGADQHDEYSLGTVNITGGLFELFVADGELLGGSYPFFCWAWIRLVPADGPAPEEMHYITAYHDRGERLETGPMTLPGISGSADATSLAMSGSQPLLTVTDFGEGRAVHWGSYDWMSHAVKGPVYGLDDLLWRGFVWAARKPFVMQGLPRFVTMRVDDVSGPFWWVEVANEFGISPWLGLFIDNLDASELSDLAALTTDGLATASVHAYTGGNFFYFDHAAATDWPDGRIAASYEEATLWHEEHGIPISSVVVPHFYEFGTNVFDGLQDWGIDFIVTMMEPGNGYGGATRWFVGGPYRSFEDPLAARHGGPVHYADYMTVPDRPDLDGLFFNCVTEIRDDAGYEWYPSADVSVTVGRGVRQMRRAFDSMVLATLFTHEPFIVGMPEESWRTALDEITRELAVYEPEYVTLDHACRYVRAMYETEIVAGEYDTGSRELDVTLSGEAEINTRFYLFTDTTDGISEQLIDVPVLSGTTVVSVATSP